METLLAILLWFAALSAGIMAGVYFTFSIFAMRALEQIGPESGMRAMQAINDVIVRSLFLPLFALSSLACLILAVAGAARWQTDYGPAMSLGGAAYVIGMFAVTAARNVPLNNRLAAADPASDTGQTVWIDYLARWTRWNHVRTAACTISLALLIVAISAFPA